MTVINVTDAVLDGVLTIHNAASNKFTGSVTYTETATTPPPEQTTGPTGGLITAFNPNKYETSTIDGLNYSSQTHSGSSWALKKLDDYTVRYELRHGDNPSWSTDADHCEMQCATEPANNTALTIAYRIMVEPGPNNGASWFVFGFEYQDTKANASPPFAVELSGDKWSVVYRSCKAGGNPANNSPDLKFNRWTAPANIERGKWYVFEVEAKTNQGSSGYLRVKIDGQQVINHSGALGFGNSGKLLAGLYRETRNETFIAHIKNLTVSWAK